MRKNRIASIALTVALLAAATAVARGDDKELASDDSALTLPSSWPGDSSFITWMERAPAQPAGSEVDKIFTAEQGDVYRFSISPNYEKLALLKTNGSRHEVAVYAMADNKWAKQSRAYSLHPAADGICPLDVRWPPDSRSLWIKFGLRDVGSGRWFHFSLSGDVLSQRDLLASVLNAKRSELGKEWENPVFDTPPPAWTLGGKQYPSAVDAYEEGYTVHDLFANRADNVVGAKMGGRVGHLQMGDETDRYTVLVDNSAADWAAHVFKDKMYLGVLSLAGPIVRSHFFVMVDDHLVMRRVWREGRLVEKPARRWAAVVGTESIDFGAASLCRIYDLHEGIIVVLRRGLCYEWIWIASRKHILETEP